MIQQTVIPEVRSDNPHEVRLRALYALVQLVEGSAPIADAQAWICAAMDSYRSSLHDTDFAGLHRLAEIQHGFIFAVSALNFDDQARLLRRSLTSIRAFHRDYG